MKINGEMVTLAREYRALGQEELARQIGCKQPQIAKIEAGVKEEIDDAIGGALARALDFPIAFFQQEEALLGFGSSSYYYRKKATLPAPERKRVHSMVNLLRIGIKKVLPHIELQPKRKLPEWSLDDYGESAANAARALRAFWHLPDGPIKNLTALIESAGVIVVPCEFGTTSIDATSLRLAEMPPLIFMNKSVPGDRWRFTIAHELAHLVIHREPHDRMEEEADAFAAEFLVPVDEIKPQLTALSRVQIRDLIPLKRHWRVSIQALIFRAYEAGVIDDTQKRSLFVRMSQLNIRQVEPEMIEAENPTNLGRMLSTMTDALQFSLDEIGTLINWNRPDLSGLLPVGPASAPRHLRVV
jgi:Zn-dependent peptidase ImmA (M78 family)/transcriptional regulator with XRE-family HTH domain